MYGYIVTFVDKGIYIAGDTENIPEMKQLTDIDVAFLLMNLPYTMTPEMVTGEVKAFTCILIITVTLIPQNELNY